MTSKKRKYEFLDDSTESEDYSIDEEFIRTYMGWWCSTEDCREPIKTGSLFCKKCIGNKSHPQHKLNPDNQTYESMSCTKCGEVDPKPGHPCNAPLEPTYN